MQRLSQEDKKENDRCIQAVSFINFNHCNSETVAFWKLGQTTIESPILHNIIQQPWTNLQIIFHPLSFFTFIKISVKKDKNSINERKWGQHAQVISTVPISKTGKELHHARPTVMWPESEVPVSWVNTVLHHASKFSFPRSCVVPLHKES